jgi:ketosteroid isomerase-like protein
MEITPGRKFYDEHLAFIQAKNFDGLINEHYNEDAVFTSFYGTIRGREALREHFRTYLGGLGDTTIQLDKLAEGEDTLLIETTVYAETGQERTYNAFVLRDGKISYHFYGVME